MQAGEDRLQSQCIPFSSNSTAPPAPPWQQGKKGGELNLTQESSSKLLCTQFCGILSMLYIKWACVIQWDHLNTFYHVSFY